MNAFEGQAEGAVPCRSQGRDWDEAKRLSALDSYKILDTPPERDFDEVAELAAQLCEAPIALVSLLDENRQFFLSLIHI